MKKINFISWSIFFIVITLSCSTYNRSSSASGGKKILVIFSEKYGGNYYLHSDIIEEYGWDLVHAAVADSVSPCPFATQFLDIPALKPDIKISDIKDLSEYDCILISSASKFFQEDPFRDLLDSPETIGLIKIFRE